MAFMKTHKNTNSKNTKFRSVDYLECCIVFDRLNYKCVYFNGFKTNRSV